MKIEIRQTVHLAVCRRVFWDLKWAVGGAGDEVVNEVVYPAVFRAMKEAVEAWPGPPHPGLGFYLGAVTG